MSFDFFNGPLADLLELKNEAIVSFALDSYPVQDSFRYRARRLGLKIAALLVDEKGELDEKRLDQLKNLLKKSFSLAPQRESDALIYVHLRHCVINLFEKREIWAAIRRFSPPLCHKRAETVIRETLWPEPIQKVETCHVRRAVMAAWLTPLRQSTGSCFATAPAILIQKEVPLQFFKDLYDLLSMGQMKRTVEGREYLVPMSLSSGDGDLKKSVPFLDRSYGFVLAMESVGAGALKEKVKEFGSQSPESLFRSLLLDQVGLTEEDLKDEEHLSRIQMAPLLIKESAIYYQKPSERGQKVALWKQKFHEACLTFRTLTECSLLKTWEYSIASFSDVKTEFARWNLFIGLGIHPNMEGGIGSFLYKRIDEEFQKCNTEIESLAKESEEKWGAMQALDAMIQNAMSEARRYQLQTEFISHQTSFNSMMQMRNHLIEKAEGLFKLFSLLIEQYDQKFQEYFQELFDPSIHEKQAHLYEDSAAGFRLVYKHARLDASQWSPVSSAEQYLHCLRDFFSNVEKELILPEQIEKDFLTEMTTALIQFIQGEEFLKAAFQRSKEKGRLSPWHYVSGGTLQTLLQSYCARAVPFKEESLIPHSAEELYDFLKQQKKDQTFLMHSPTHAFTFYPNLLFEEFSQKQKDQTWDERMQEHLAIQLSERIDFEERALFLHLFRQKNPARSNEEFRKNLIDSLKKEALIDSMLYEKTPVYDAFFAKEAVNRILKSLGREEKIEDLEGNFFGPYDLYQMVKTTLLNSLKSALSEIDWDQRIVEELRKERLCPDFSLFADTNWSGWFFGFVCHPVSGNMELWRLNRSGMQGFPMNDWKEWLSRENSAAWTILSEYFF